MYEAEIDVEVLFALAFRHDIASFGGYDNDCWDLADKVKGTELKVLSSQTAIVY